MRCQFLKENRNKYNINKACKILKISRSGYYDYVQRKKSNRTIENEALIEMIEDYSMRIMADMEQGGFSWYLNGKASKLPQREFPD